MLNINDEALIAERQIRPYIRETPLDFSFALSKRTGAQVYLKCENMQYTGSFKVRGAFNKLLSLTASQRSQGVVTASTGNHGTAVALGLDNLKIPGTIFVPETVSSAKVENIRNIGVPIEFYATDCMQTEVYAREYAQRNNMTYISPYNDLKIIGGQGTIGLEIIRQLDKIDVILAPIGGGGLIAGIGACIKAVSPKTRIIGCLPENSPVMSESIKANRIIEMATKSTISDATAGGIEPGAITFDLCKKLVDDYCLVSENEIKHAINTLLKTHRLLIEGAAAVALASLIKKANQFQGKNVVTILSGANISFETLKEIMGA